MFSEEQMVFFHQIFHPSLPRLGPGDDNTTRKALETLLAARAERGFSPGPLRALDLGCGTGAPTLMLARHIQGSILAVDIYQPYLDELQRRAGAAGVADRITTRQADMASLEFAEGSFDLIWSEGVFSIIGFQEQLKACFPWLAPGGVMAVSDLNWFKPDPPAECRQFLEEAVPDLTDIETSLEIIRKIGYQVEGHFPLPGSSWWDPFYCPLEARLSQFRQKFSDAPDRLEIIEAIQKEIDIYRRHSAYYGYGFYMLSKA